MLVIESGAFHPQSDRAMDYAKSYYARIRKQSSDCRRISVNTAMPIESVSAVKSHIFYNYHNLDSGFKRFSPSFEVAESWVRLQGNDKSAIQHHDITMLRHALCELKYMLSTGCSYETAHNYAQSRHNYAKEAARYYRRVFGINI